MDSSRTFPRIPTSTGVIAALLATGLFAAACGGGSGGGGSPTAGDPHQPQTQLDAIDRRIAAQAYPAGNAPRGTAQTVAIWDGAKQPLRIHQHGRPGHRPRGHRLPPPADHVSHRQYPHRRPRRTGRRRHPPPPAATTSSLAPPATRCSTPPSAATPTSPSPSDRQPRQRRIHAGRLHHHRGRPRTQRGHRDRRRPIHPGALRVYGDGQTPNPCGSDAYRQQHGYTCLAAFTGWAPTSTSCSAPPPPPRTSPARWPS